MTAIAEIIGVPPADREQFKVWSDQALATLGTGFFAPPTVEQVKRQLTLREEMNRYFVPLAEARRRDPQPDLLTGLVQAEHEGSKLDQDEMLAMLVLLLVAGNETTTTLIGNAVLALLDHPGELKRLRDDPALLPTAIDEVLRFSSPVQFDPRRVTRRTQIAGTPIGEDTMLLCWLGSANRDERRYQDPDRFDVTRDARESAKTRCFVGDPAVGRRGSESRSGESWNLMVRSAIWGVSGIRAQHTAQVPRCRREQAASSR